MRLSTVHQFPTLDTLKSHLDVVLSYQLWVTLLEQGLGQVSSREFGESALGLWGLKCLVSPCWRRKKLEKSFHWPCVSAAAVLSYLDKVQMSQVLFEHSAGVDDVPRLAGLTLPINTAEPFQKEKSTASN